MGETIRIEDNKKNAPPARSSQPLMKTLYAEHAHMSMVMQVFKEQLGAIECALVLLVWVFNLGRYDGHAKDLTVRAEV